VASSLVATTIIVFDERRAKGFQLAIDDLERMDGVIGVGVAGVDQMGRGVACGSTWRRKRIPVPAAQVRALNQAGKISDHKSAAEFGAMSAVPPSALTTPRLARACVNG